MAGKKWSRKERAALRKALDQGRTISDILEDPKLLRGRTRDSIAQQIRRHRWADPEKSRRCREVEHMTDEQHDFFVQFIRRHGEAPIEQLAISWNNWAHSRSWPKVTPGRVLYWIEKLHIPHSRSDAWQSQFSRNKRKKRRAEELIERLGELERRKELERLSRLDEVRRLRREDRSLAYQKCGRCKNRWLLHDHFFSHVPRTFALEGEFLTGFQTQYCQFCRITDDWTLHLLRAHGKDVSHIVAERRRFQRQGLDLLWEKLRKEYVETCLDLIGRRKNPRLRSCIRCEDVWLIETPYFRRNPRPGSFRGLCTFCDGWYDREIDRCKRDGRDPGPLRKERHHYLELARKAHRFG
ncbi:MAG: hypothetical protein U0136_09865 [Bdellovibrionota bacterium]